MKHIAYGNITQRNEEKEVIYALIEYFHKSGNAFKMLERLGYVPFDDEALESL